MKIIVAYRKTAIKIKLYFQYLILEIIPSMKVQTVEEKLRRYK
jgi:hypothetical protein